MGEGPTQISISTILTKSLHSEINLFQGLSSANQYLLFMNWRTKIGMTMLVSSHPANSQLLAISGNSTNHLPAFDRPHIRCPSENTAFFLLSAVCLPYAIGHSLGFTWRDGHF
jgi:hypothetical protein